MLLILVLCFIWVKKFRGIHKCQPTKFLSKSSVFVTAISLHSMQTIQLPLLEQTFRIKILQKIT